MLRIINGRVIDPLHGVNAAADVSVEDGRIVEVGRIKPGADSDQVIDAAGCMVVPGLIDHHAHLYPLAKIGLPAEAVCFASGVTTVVDAGSAGCDTYEQNRAWIQISDLRIKAYLNVCATGLDSLPVLEDVNPRHWNEDRILACFDRFQGELLGLKLRTSAPIVGELGYGPLRAAVRLAEKIGTAVMIHCTNPPGDLKELLDILRPGDILTHLYMNQGSS